METKNSVKENLRFQLHQILIVKINTYLLQRKHNKPCWKVQLLTSISICANGGITKGFFRNADMRQIMQLRDSYENRLWSLRLQKEANKWF